MHAVIEVITYRTVLSSGHDTLSNSSLGAPVNSPCANNRYFHSSPSPQQNQACGFHSVFPTIARPLSDRLPNLLTQCPSSNKKIYITYLTTFSTFSLAFQSLETCLGRHPNAARSTTTKAECSCHMVIRLPGFFSDQQDFVWGHGVSFLASLQ